jgi:hypothetical protein
MDSAFWALRCRSGEAGRRLRRPRTRPPNWGPSGSVGKISFYRSERWRRGSPLKALVLKEVSRASSLVDSTQDAALRVSMLWQRRGSITLAIRGANCVQQGDDIALLAITARRMRERVAYRREALQNDEKGQDGRHDWVRGGRPALASLDLVIPPPIRHSCAPTTFLVLERPANRSARPDADCRKERSCEPHANMGGPKTYPLWRKRHSSAEPSCSEPPRPLQRSVASLLVASERVLGS